MGPFEMVALIVVAGCVTGTVQEWLKRRPAVNEQTILSELRALKDEVRQLRQQNADLILGLDTALPRLAEQLDARRSLPPADGDTQPAALHQ